MVDEKLITGGEGKNDLKASGRIVGGSITTTQLIIDELNFNAENSYGEINMDAITVEDSDFSEWNKSYEGVFDIVHIDELFLEHMGLTRYQKELMRMEMKRMSLEKDKDKKINMRESVNTFLKKGKRW